MEKIVDNIAKRAALKTDLQSKIDQLNQLADQQTLSDLDRAAELAAEASQLAASGLFADQPYRKGLADSLYLLGYINSKKGNMQLNLAQAAEALQLYEAIQDLSGQAKTLSSIGFAYAILGNYGEALAHGLKGLELARQVGDLEIELLVLNSIGVSYAMAEKYDQALKHFLKCLEIDIQFGSDKVCVTLNNCSLCYYHMGDYLKSLDYGRRCLDAALQNDKQYMAVSARDRMAEAYIRLGEFEEAEAHLQMNMAVLSGPKISKRRHRPLLNLGQLRIKQNRPAEALVFLQEALALTESGEAHNYTYDTLQYIVEAYKQLGDFEQAFAASEKRLLTREKLFERQIADKVKGLEVIYQTKEAQKESEIFRLKNVELEQEVVERMRAEAAATRQTHYIKMLLENTPFGIVMLDMDLRIEECNLAFEQLFNYSRTELIGRNIRQIFDHPIVQNDFQVNYQKLMKGETVRWQTKRPSHDGELIDVDLTAVPIVVDGQRQGILLSHQDIRERIQTEATLREAKFAAEAATRAKSAFLANMSHEIRTPLNGVVGMTSLLQKTKLTAEQEEFVQVIRSSSDALLEIINEILDFSKIEAGKLKLEERPFDVRLTIEAALDVLAPKAAEKGLELGYWIDESIPTQIVGDATRFRQILVNLLGNAVKFTEDGEVFVLVERDGEGDGRYQIKGSVRDTGIGIPQQRISKLFQSFNQVDESTTRKFGGTGLGLAISKRLSELMGGTMWVESQIGKGSTFYFTVETKTADKQAPPVIEPDMSILAGKRVLIVDSQDSNRLILSRYLASWKMQSLESRSFDGAKSVLKRDADFDALLLNRNQVDGNCSKAVAEIRAAANRPQMPVILLASFGRTYQAELSKVFLLAKPIKPSRLFNVFFKIFANEPVVTKPRRKGTAVLSNGHKNQKLRLLLAEDNLINQKVALRMLEKLGYSAEVAGNGLEALHALETKTFDIVFMDVQMPEMDGVTATQHIHERFAPEKRPYIIAMTANALVGDREKYLDSGMDDYLSKPVRLSELQNAIISFSQKRS